MDYECERCHRPIKPGREVWVEMTTTGKYDVNNLGTIPEALSQGMQAFGADCARSLRQYADRNPGLVWNKENSR